MIRWGDGHLVPSPHFVFGRRTGCGVCLRTLISKLQTRIEGTTMSRSKKTRMFRYKSFCFISIMIVFLGGSCFADIKLPSIIRDSMVLQQKSDVTIWGWASPGEDIEVEPSWANVVSSSQADKNGRWNIEVKTSGAGGPYGIKIRGNNEIVLKDVLIGEVWLCSGQSNMEWVMRHVVDSENEIKAANFPRIRLFRVGKNASMEPLEDCSGAWMACSPDSVKGFSAAAYYFGRELHARLDVPVGLIDSSYGGTSAREWTIRECLEHDKDYEQIIARVPGRVYCGMISPIIQYHIKGMIWYQGESDAPRAYLYRKLFPNLVKCLRNQRGIGDFPFYYVQIPPFHYGNPEGGTIVPELQEAQAMALDLVANTGMVVTTDIGDVDDLHPRNKRDVGKRLAALALTKTYGFDGIPTSGPMYKNMRIEGNCIRLHFDFANNGLMSKGGPLREFKIAGDDEVF